MHAFIDIQDQRQSTNFPFTTDSTLLVNAKQTLPSGMIYSIKLGIMPDVALPIHIHKFVYIDTTIFKIIFSSAENVKVGEATFFYASDSSNTTDYYDSLIFDSANILIGTIRVSLSFITFCKVLFQTYNSDLKLSKTSFIIDSDCLYAEATGCCRSILVNNNYYTNNVALLSDHGLYGAFGTPYTTGDEYRALNALDTTSIEDTEGVTPTIPIGITNIVVHTKNADNESTVFTDNVIDKHLLIMHTLPSNVRVVTQEPSIRLVPVLSE